MASVFDEMFRSYKDYLREKTKIMCKVNTMRTFKDALNKCGFKKALADIYSAEINTANALPKLTELCDSIKHFISESGFGSDSDVSSIKDCAAVLPKKSFVAFIFKSKDDCDVMTMMALSSIEKLHEGMTVDDLLDFAANTFNVPTMMLYFVGSKGYISTIFENVDERSMIGCTISTGLTYGQCFNIPEASEEYEKGLLETIGVERILFSKDATVVFFADGTKEVAKCCKEDEYNAITGVSIALAKKLIGRQHFHDLLNNVMIPQTEQYKLDMAKSIKNADLSKVSITRSESDAKPDTKTKKVNVMGSKNIKKAAKTLEKQAKVAMEKATKSTKKTTAKKTTKEKKK